MRNRTLVGILVALSASTPAMAPALADRDDMYYGNTYYTTPYYGSPYYGNPQYYVPTYNDYDYRGYAPHVRYGYSGGGSGLGAAAGILIDGLLASPHGHRYDY